MKTIVYNGDIDDDGLEDLISQIESAGGEDEFMIYMSSRGGTMKTMECMVHYLSTLTHNGKKIKMVAYHELSSSAFMVFFMSAVDREILDSAHSVVHLPGLHLNKVTINSDERLLLLQTCSEIYSLCLTDWYKKIGFTKEELDKIMSYQNVILNSARLRKITPVAYEGWGKGDKNE